MSAYVMDPREIAHIGKFVERYAPKGKLFVYRNDRPYDENYRTGQQVAETLMAENVRSVNFRYKENDEAPKVDVAGYPGHAVDSVQVGKLVSTWDYQACECDDYKQTDAYETYVKLLELLVEVLSNEKLELERRLR